MKVAYFSPLPPSTSGIADYSALLLPALERLVEVDVVRPGRTRPVADADVALYHIGNDPDAHGWILDALRRRSGVVVLHDFVVHHLIAGATIGRNDGHAYLSAMEREAGAAGRMLAWGVLEGRVPPLWEVRPAEFPLVGEILDRATGIVVHSHYVEALVREAGYDGPLWVIPHPAWPAEDVEPADVHGAPLLGSFGHLNENKRVHQLLRAFAELHATHDGARLLLVGSEAPGWRLRMELPEGVIREPYVEEPRLMALMAACDAVALLRSPTMGETSGSAIRTLSLGKPLVVSDLGWFAELPDDVAIKIPVGDGEEAALVAALERFSDPAVARAMGERAKAYVAEVHGLDHVAELYAAALEQAAGGAAVEAQVLHDVAAAAADTGVEPDVLAPDLRELGLVGHARDLAPPRDRRALPGSPLLWLGGLYAVAVAVVLSLALRVHAPWIMVDEMVYSDAARSFAAHGNFLIRGAHAEYGYVYQLLLAIPYALASKVADAYDYARVVNALVMCSVVFPVYLLARRVVRPQAALAAAALAVAVPPLVYVGTLMTENVFYPLFAWIALALVVALERPTARNQIVVLVLCGVAFVTRAQAVALALAVLTAPLALAWIERGRPRRLSPWRVTYGIVAAAALVVVIVEVAQGNSPSHVLGGHSDVGQASYRVWPVVEWIVLHLAGLDLSLFVLPAAAMIVVVASARHLDRPLRVFAAAAASLTVWLVLEVGAFASHFSERIEERNLFYLAPLFLIALFAWIERGQPRPSRAIVVAAVVAAILPGAIPFTQLLNTNSESDTPFLQPWWFLQQEWTGHEGVTVAVVATALVLATAFLWLSPRFAGWLPVLVAVGFLCTWLPLELWNYSFAANSKAALAAGVPADKTWIDDAVGPDADVAVLWSGGDDPYRVWENEFWNRSVHRVYGFGGSTLAGGMPEIAVAADPATGLIRGLADDYVVTDKRVQLLGQVVASDPTHQLLLYRIRKPARLSTEITGWFPDNWTTNRASWTRIGCTGGSLRLTVFTDPVLYSDVVQRISITGTTPAHTVVLPPKATKQLVLPLTPDHGTCVVRLHIVPARVPALFPNDHSSDTRRLGIHVAAFTYRP
ncbi:MAG: glycosyltransferase family 4 protein [Actinomycetota bacterium]